MSKESRNRYLLSRKVFPTIVVIPGIILLIFGVAFAVYWNNFVFLKKGLEAKALIELQVKDIPNFDTEIDKTLSFHPELGNDEIIISLYPWLLAKLAQKNAAELPALKHLVSTFEKHTIAFDTPRPYLHLARIYSFLFLTYGDANDYVTSEKYFRKVLYFKPNDPYSLYDLYCLYGITGNEKGYEEMGARILKNWGKSPQGTTCEII